MNMSEPARSTDVVGDDLIDEMLAGLALFREHAWHIDTSDDCDQPRVLTWSGKVVAVCEDSDAGLIRARHIARCSPENISALLARISRAPIEAVADALQDSAYLAGAKAGYNAAQADDPNAAFERLVNSRAGYLKPIKDAQAARPAHPLPQGEAEPADESERHD